MKRSAGILLYRFRDPERCAIEELEVFLVHPGGPLWAKRDQGAWSIPKEEYVQGEDPLVAGRREFLDETGHAPEGPFLPLGTVRQPGGKRVCAWAARGELDPAQLCSNTFMLEWPPRSGQRREFPEVDRGAWFAPLEAHERLLPAQHGLLDALIEALSRAQNESSHDPF